MLTGAIMFPMVTMALSI